MTQQHQPIDLGSTSADPAAPSDAIVIPELAGVSAAAPELVGESFAGHALGADAVGGDPLGGPPLAPQDAGSPDIVKRSIVVAGHKTSVSLEDAFWHALKDISRERRQSLRSLVAEIDAGRKGGNLSSAVRLHVLDHYRRRAGAASA